MKRLVAGLALFALALVAVGVNADPPGGILLPIISVTPTSYDFGQVPVGAVAQGAVLVTNEGEAPLVVTQVKTKLPFSDGADSFTLAGGQSRRINIAFAPPSPGQYNSFMTINSNANNAKLLKVPLSGTGVQ